MNAFVLHDVGDRSGVLRWGASAAAIVALHAALDGETLAMVRRAQPFPGFPPEMKQGSMSFNVPVQFSIR
jgi:protein TonB